MSSSIFKCNFCQQEFNLKSNLTTHLKTAKYCLELQGKDSSICCQFCHKSFATKYTVAVHQQNCIDRVRLEFEMKLAKTVEESDEKLQQTLFSTAQQYEDKLSSIVQQYEDKLLTTKQIYEEKIASLTHQYETQLSSSVQKHEMSSQRYQDLLLEKDKHIEMLNKHIGDFNKSTNQSLVEIAKQKNSTVINNNNQQITKTQNNTQYNLFGPLNLTQEHVRAIIEQHLTTEVIGDGQVGLANMIHDKLLTNAQKQPLYVRTDINRNHFGYQNATGEFVRDPKAQTLKKAIITAGVGAKAIDKVRSAFAKDSAKLNAYLPMALEINDLRHKDAKFRQQLTILSPDCKDVHIICGDSDDDDEDEDQDENVDNVEDDKNVGQAGDVEAEIPEVDEENIPNIPNIPNVNDCEMTECADASDASDSNHT